MTVYRYRIADSLKTLQTCSLISSSGVGCSDGGKDGTGRKGDVRADPGIEDGSA